MLPPRGGENGAAEIIGAGSYMGAVNQESWGAPPKYSRAALGAMETTFYP